MTRQQQFEYNVRQYWAAIQSEAFMLMRVYKKKLEDMGARLINGKWILKDG